MLDRADDEVDVSRPMDISPLRMLSSERRALPGAVSIESRPDAAELIAETWSRVILGDRGSVGDAGARVALWTSGSGVVTALSRGVRRSLELAEPMSGPRVDREVELASTELLPVDEDRRAPCDEGGGENGVAERGLFCPENLSAGKDDDRGGNGELPEATSRRPVREGEVPSTEPA